MTTDTGKATARKITDTICAAAQIGWLLVQGTTLVLAAVTTLVAMYRHDHYDRAIFYLMLTFIVFRLNVGEWVDDAYAKLIIHRAGQDRRNQFYQSIRDAEERSMGSPTGRGYE